MKRILILLIVIALLLVCACNNNINETETGQSLDVIDLSPQDTLLENTSTEEGKAMNDRLITKEELFDYIQTHDVGLQVEDFDGVDVDDFIAYWYFSPSNINNLWRKSLESYLVSLEWDERAKYMAREKFCIESTDDEYERFIKKFLEAINKKVVLISRDLGFYRYDINTDSDTMSLFIAQTKNIEELNIYSNEKSTTPELLEVFIANGPDGAGMSGNFCYSKNKKYIIIAYPYDEQLFEYVKIFCEIDD